MPTRTHLCLLRLAANVGPAQTSRQTLAKFVGFHLGCKVTTNQFRQLPLEYGHWWFVMSIFDRPRWRPPAACGVGVQ